MAFDRSMPTIDRVEQFNPTQVSCRQAIRILQSHADVASELAIQFAYHLAQLFIHHPCKANQIRAVSRSKGREIFVSAFKVRVARWVSASQTFCDFAAYEIGLEIDETVHHDCDAITLHESAINEAPHLSREIVPEVSALPS